MYLTAYPLVLLGKYKNHQYLFVEIGSKNTCKISNMYIISDLLRNIFAWLTVAKAIHMSNKNPKLNEP